MTKMTKMTQFNLGDKVKVTSSFVKTAKVDRTNRAEEGSMFVNSEMVKVKELTVVKIMNEYKVQLSDGYFYFTEWLELVEDTVQTPVPNPHNVPPYKVELLKALLEGKTIQYYNSIHEKWLDSVHVIYDISERDEDTLRVKPAEPVVSYLYKAIHNDTGGVLNFESDSIQNVNDYYSSSFNQYVRVKYHDDMYVNSEIIYNPEL